MSRSLLAFLLGCAAAAPALAQPAGRPDPAPAAGEWERPPIEVRSAETIRAFWSELHDPTLDSLLAEMLHAGLDVRAAEARLAGARALRRAAELEMLPAGGLVAGYTRQRLSPAAFPNGSGTFPDQDIWEAGVEAAWEIDLSGRLRRALSARRAEVAASGAALRDVQVALAAELARTYFELRGAQEQLAVAERNTENQRRTLALTHERLDAGRGTAFDTERAAAQLAVTESSIPAFAAAVAAAQHRICVLVGRDPGGGHDDLDAPAPLPSPPALDAIPDPDEVIRVRPDVAAAESRALAEAESVAAARAEGRPRLAVGASAGYTANALGAFGDRGTFRYVVSGGVSWPAFGLGRVKAGVAVARSREEIARIAFEQTRLLAREQIESTLVRARAARARVAGIRAAAASSTRAADLARMRFADGLGDLLDVLDAERTQLDAERALVQARTEEAAAYAALYQAIGGAWPLPAAPAP